MFSTQTVSNNFVILPLHISAVEINLKSTLKLIKILEKRDIVLSTRLTNTLVRASKEIFDRFYDEILLETKSMKGQFLKESFASGHSLEDEQMTVLECTRQIYQYFYVYGLCEIPEDLFTEFESRKIEVKNVSKKTDKQKINNTYKILDVKIPKEFSKYLNTLLESPIVLGAQQLEMFKIGKELGLLDISNVNIKVKENLFVIISLCGKEIVKTQRLLKTANDILRYANYVSGADYRTFTNVPRYTLSTFDKKIIMNALNNLELYTAYAEMKPRYSFWLALSRNLFPGASKFKKFKNAQDIFYLLRNDDKSVNIPQTFNSITEMHIFNDDMIKLTEHLAQKPGELLRRIDMIIRKAKNGQTKEILKIVTKIELNPKLILQVKKWIEYRAKTENIERIVTVKGKSKTLPKQLLKLKSKRAAKVIYMLEQKLISHFANKELFKD